MQPNFRNNYNNNNYNNNNYKKTNYPTRVNYYIKAPMVRVVRDGQQLGIHPIEQARRLAQDANLDLVELVPNAHPPVCGILDFGKYKFEQKIKEKEAARKQKESQQQLKEIRLSHSIADHDIEMKITQAKKFLDEGKMVQFNLKLKGQRELIHRDQGYAVMNRIVTALTNSGSVDRNPKMEGKSIVVRVNPKV